MFCNTPQVNQLTALLLAHKVRHVVVCPGSRNAVIVHNLNELAKEFNIYPVTDERSAAFVALGLTLSTQQPAAVCVTSGSALLACLPAVAEACFRHLPLLVISADRPPEWIGQLDGQTLPQQGALLPYCPTQQLCIPHTADDQWTNNLRINEALLSLHRNGGYPAHINVPIAEPMFSFTTEHLPQERVIHEYAVHCECPLPQSLIEKIKAARLPALLIGQYERGDLRKEVADLDAEGKMLVLPEVISDVAGSMRINIFDNLTEDDAALIPDLVVQIGGNFVHKRFKALLRQADCHVIRIGCEENLPDTFQHLEAVVRCNERAVLAQLSASLPLHQANVERALLIYNKGVANYLQEEKSERLSFGSILQELRQALAESGASCSLHLGNSTAVRAAAKVFPSGEMQIYCNRGTNGIEGSLSTAVGYALGMWGLTIAVLGDLSFFYDSNALWNVQLPAGLRVLLVNDGHGGIFDHLPGLSASSAKDTFISAGGGHFTAEGIAASYHLGYHTASHAKELPQAIREWLKEAPTAQILEVFLEK